VTLQPPPDAAGVEVVFEQAGAARRIEAVPLAQLSIELGHLYLDDFRAGPQRLRDHFAQVAPWVQAARDAPGHGRGSRISTCYLIDDYFSAFSSPDEVVPALVAAAQDAGLEIDYLARESACANADGTPLAAIVAGHLVADPPPGTTGSRPPAVVSGWLCNGTRSPAGGGEAMSAPQSWYPPRQNAAERHSVFVDVELWDEDKGQPTWSCAFLATVWQLLRLGLLRDDGRRVADPRPWTEPWPRQWADLPSVVRLTGRPAPFSAYRTLSILDIRFLPVELAVRTIVDQVAVDAVTNEQVLSRARDERIELPGEVADRLRYVFL
jgi:hypothetical protein